VICECDCVIVLTEIFDFFLSLLIVFLVLFKRAAWPVWPDGPMAWHGLRKSHVGQAWADRSACRAARPGTIIRPGLCRPGQDGPGPGQALDTDEKITPKKQKLRKMSKDKIKAVKAEVQRF
jgi:hypothetical protein